MVYIALESVKRRRYEVMRVILDLNCPMIRSELCCLPWMIFMIQIHSDYVVSKGPVVSWL